VRNIAAPKRAKVVMIDGIITEWARVPVLMVYPLIHFFRYPEPILRRSEASFLFVHNCYNFLHKYHNEVTEFRRSVNAGHC